MEATTKRRPIRGLLYGLMLGIGLMLLVVGQGIAALGTWPPFLLLILGIVFGVFWSTMGPAKAPKGPAPVVPDMVDEQPAPTEVPADDPAPAESDTGDTGETDHSEAEDDDGAS